MSSVRVQEGAIVLQFESDRWVKWDEDRAFLEGLRGMEGTRAVDVCADVLEVGPVLIELKDFRGAAIENTPRLRSGELAREIAAKVRDTLAGMMWASGRGIGKEWHERLTRDLVSAPKLKVVLWLEEDRIDVGGRSALQDTIRAGLKPHVEATVIVTCTAQEKTASRPLRWLRAEGAAAPRLARRGERARRR